MANQLISGGAVPSKPSKSAPLYVARFWSGLWTQRNVLREGATPFIQEKFYSATRNDTLLDGLNTEISNRLTLIRRPGTSEYNSQTFSDVDFLYAFRDVNESTHLEHIHVMVDTASGGTHNAGVIYHADAPNNKEVIWNKSVGAGQTYFQSVGSVLFMADGVDKIQWGGDTGVGPVQWGLVGPANAPQVNYPTWRASHAYASPLIIEDEFFSLQYLSQTGYSGTVNTDATGLIVTWAAGTQFPTDGSWNGVTITINGNPYTVAAFNSAADSETTLRTTGAVASSPLTGVAYSVAADSGVALPNWARDLAGTTNDAGLVWTNYGNQNLVTTDFPSAATTYRYAFKRPSTGEVSSASPASNYPTHHLDGSPVTVIGDDLASVYLTTGDKIEIYRTPSGGATWIFVDEIDAPPVGAANKVDISIAGTTYAVASGVAVTGGSGTGLKIDILRVSATGQIQAIAINTQGSGYLTTDTGMTIPAGDGAARFAINSIGWMYVDTVVDADLNELIEAAINGANNPPPDGIINLVYYLGRMFGSVGNVIPYSLGPDVTTGSGNSAFSPTNTFTVPSLVKRMWPTALGLIVFTSSDSYIILGQGTSQSPLYIVPYITKLSLSSYNTFDTNGASAYMVTSDQQLVLVEPGSGVTEVGFQIGDKITSGVPVSVAYHNGGSTDKALYVVLTDGTWYRMNQTSAPESGATWSPSASVTASGVSLAQTIEDPPGTWNLLMVSKAGGPILKRDLSVFTDDGDLYSAWATVGSLVLAQPGQTADIGFVTDECTPEGTFPNLVLYLDQDSRKAGAVPFTLTTYVNDPPVLAPSTTLPARRYYLSDTPSSSECRSLQIKFDWGVSDTPDELLSYTIWGEPRIEQ